MAIAMRYGTPGESSGATGGSSGGVTFDLLWTNPSPSTNFAPQTLSFDLSGYSYIAIDLISGRSGSTYYYSETKFINIQHFGQTNAAYRLILNDALAPAYRDITGITSSSITFGSGYRSGTNNSVCSPLAIYGVKF